MESLNICKKQDYIVVTISSSNDNSNQNLIVFKRELCMNKTTSRLKNALALPPSSPERVKKVINFKYAVEAPNKGVHNSAIGTKFSDSYILDNPIMFFFSSEPKVMTTMIFYEHTAKRICTVETLHEDNLVNSVRTEFHLVSIGNCGIVNAL